MLTTLDAKPQEWMEGAKSVLHTVSACHFQSVEHAEYWIDKLVPKDANDRPVKWSGGRRKDQTRRIFIENCLKHQDEIDFKINCVSSPEGEMSWFAWAFYFQNQSLVSQRLDAKRRNCLVFSGLNGGELSFPVLRAGYLIWYHHVVRYLVEFKHISGKFLSDNFCNDELGPGQGKALGVGFVNYLLSLSSQKPQISLPTVERLSKLDIISDAMCGWVNSVRTQNAPPEYVASLELLESIQTKPIDNIVYAMDLRVVDENGKDVTSEVKKAVINGVDCG